MQSVSHNLYSRVLYRGESLQSLKLEMGGLVVFFVPTILEPLLMLTPKMAAAKRKGLADYGQVAQTRKRSREKIEGLFSNTRVL